jgi:4-hydroxy 2-oxovalerate aldolase
MLLHHRDDAAKGNLVEFRPDIKVLDCSVRDGSLVNDARFEDGFVRAVYDACAAAGVDYMELGYKSSQQVYSTNDFGPWKFCKEDDLRRVVGDNPHNIKLSVMADSHRTDYHTDILPKEQSVIDMVRVACYIHQIPGALDLVKDAHDKGYETTLNLMSISRVSERELSDGLEVVAKSPVDVMYLVDSFGSLYPETTRDLALGYLEIMKSEGKEVGIHAHNNQQLAFANTIQALTVGVNYLDATIYGLGRGAGNCPMELLLGFLRNPKFDIRPILACITNAFLPLRETTEWGYDIPYMITGQFNEHPREAIKFLDTGNKDYLSFYKTIEDF